MLSPIPFLAFSIAVIVFLFGTSVEISNGIRCSLTTVFANILNTELTDKPISVDRVRSQMCHAVWEFSQVPELINEFYLSGQ